VKNILPQSVTPDDDLYGDIEDDIDSLDDSTDHDQGSTVEAKEPPIDASLLSLADDKLRNEMIKPFEKILDVPWVAVSGLHVTSILSQTHH
jgi:DNA replication initiation complex subunit (GINS family)